MDIGSGMVASKAVDATMQVIGHMMNERGAKRIATYNNLENRKNMVIQNAMNVANQNSQRLYDSPREQMLRMTEAGLNPFTAQQMLQSDTGISSPGVQSSPSSAVYNPINFDFSNLVSAMTELDKLEDNEKGRKWQSSENALDRKETKDNLRESLSSAAEIEKMRQQYSMLQAMYQVNADLQKMREQNAWQSSENKSAREFERATQLMLEQARMKFQKQLQESQNVFTSGESAKERDWQDKSRSYQNEYESNEYRRRVEFDTEHDFKRWWRGFPSKK